MNKGLDRGVEGRACFFGILEGGDDRGGALLGRQGGVCGVLDRIGRGLFSENGVMVGFFAGKSGGGLWEGETREEDSEHVHIDE